MNLSLAQNIRHLLITHASNFALDKPLRAQSLVVALIDKEYVFDTFEHIIENHAGFSMLIHIGAPNEERPNLYNIRPDLANMLKEKGFSPMKLTSLTDRNLGEALAKEERGLDWNEPLFNRYGQVKLHPMDGRASDDVRIVSFKVRGLQTKYPVNAQGKPLLMGMDEKVYGLHNTYQSQEAEQIAQPRDDAESEPSNDGFPDDMPEGLKKALSALGTAFGDNVEVKVIHVG